MSTELVMRCATCGKPKPNDATWARTATCCGASRWVGHVTFAEAPGVASESDSYSITVTTVATAPRHAW